MGKYITKLSNEELTQFLRNNGYIVCENLTSRDGFPLKSIERTDNIIMARVRKNQSTKVDTGLAYGLAKKYNNFMSLSKIGALNETFDSSIEIVHFSDFYCDIGFEIYHISSESKKLYDAYTEFMSEKFPEYKYQNDRLFNRDFNSEQAM